MNTPGTPSDSLFFVYGPPGSGKTTIGRLLGNALDLPFVDLDNVIEADAGMDIPAIFAQEGETAFRSREKDALRKATSSGLGVVALGGGALLSPENRSFVDKKGKVVCLLSDQETLVKRLEAETEHRPLLGGGEGWQERLNELLKRRKDHYESFPIQVQTTRLSPEEAAWQAQISLGAFRVSGMGNPYDIRVVPRGIAQLGSMLFARGLKGPIALVGDQNTLPLYGDVIVDSLRKSGYTVHPCTIPAGESTKNIDTIGSLWSQFLAGGLERGSTVVAVGGGVTGDMSGFAAATYLRGIRWVALPTTLLSMVDASLGGKTGCDLPQGKNLVGAFHPPSLVLADPEVLSTLPQGELRSGMAEVVKHGIIADPLLFDLCSSGWDALRGPDPEHPDWTKTVKRAIAVKVRVIQQDPFEKGIRASLNLGHTIGHAIEAASHFQIRHGEAVSIGTVTITRIAEHAGLCETGLADCIRDVFDKLDLPTEMPYGLDPVIFINALRADKKKANGQVRFAIPVKIGEVITGVSLDINLLSLLPEHA